MAKFLKNGPGRQVTQENKAASKSQPPFGTTATTVRLIRLAKPANDNPAPLATRLRRWAPFFLAAVAVLLWLLLR
jgi:hypothetical protein